MCRQIKSDHCLVLGRQLTYVHTISPKTLFFIDTIKQRHFFGNECFQHLGGSGKYIEDLSKHNILLDLLIYTNTNIVTNTNQHKKKSSPPLPNPAEDWNHPYFTSKKMSVLILSIKTNVLGILYIHYWVICQAVDNYSFFCLHRRDKKKTKF